MQTKTPSWLRVRSSQCAGLFDCGLSYARGIVMGRDLADVLDRLSRGTCLASNMRSNEPGAYDCAEHLRRAVRELARPAGLEPATPRFEVWCSIR
jgi:hypothetical protein